MLEYLLPFDEGQIAKQEARQEGLMSRPRQMDFLLYKTRATNPDEPQEQEHCKKLLQENLQEK